MIIGRLILIKLIWFLLQIAPLFSFNSCLILRSYCLRTPECTPFLDKFEKSCGYNTETCTGSSPSDCVHTLRQLRSFFPHDNCVCYDALGSRTECEWFRQAIFSNPCEKRLEDIGYERKLTNLEEYFDKRPVSAPHENEVLIDGRPVTESSLLRRSTRTPIADQIREWKEELSGELQTRNVIKKLTCNEALYDVCLKHISCKQLWRLFRQSCEVDAQNTCQMTDRETCWQSFEGLTWTGLGSCSCQTNNSDCHWIRLHTNYNKCIYEISRSGEFNALASYEPPGQSRISISPPAPVPPPSAPIRGLPGPEARPDPRLDPRYRGEPYITENPLLEIDDPDLDGPVRKTTQVSRVLPTDKTTVRPTTRRLTTTTTTTKATISITTTTPRTTTTVPQRILQDTRDRYTTLPPSTAEKWWITTTTTTQYPLRVDSIKYQRQQYEEAMRRHKQQQQQQSGRMPPSSSLPGAGPPSRMGGTKSYPTTPRPPYTGPTKRYPQFTPKTNTARSSCQDAQARCSADDSCAWHMAELSVRCQMETCRRDDCATALRRFTTYVARPLAEPLMFCHCAENDEECFEQQALLYPKCLYSSPTLAETCTEVVIDCSQDVRCFQLRTSIASVCEVSRGECIARSLDHCRQTLLHSRGSLLEAPCYCPMNDMECLKYQASMIPNNPCIEKAMVDYSRLMGYMDKKQNGREQSLRAQLTHSPSSGRNLSSSAAPYKFQGGTPSASRTSPGRGGGVYSGRTESSALDSSGTKDGRGRATQGSVVVQSEESIETDAPVINSGRNIKLEQPKSKTTVNPGSYESYETFLVTKPDDQLIETAILTGDEGRSRDKEAGSRRVDYTKNQGEKGGSIGGNGRNGERDNRTQAKKSETEEKERRGDITVSEEEDAKKKRKEKMEEERRKQKEMREKQREEQRRKDAEMREKKRNEEKMKEKERKEARDRNEEMDKEKEKKAKEEKKNSMDDYVSRKNSKKVSSKISEKSDDKKADEDDIKATEKFPRPIQRQRQRTTTAPPTTTKAPELPPWATSTSTVEPSTTEYITIPPPLTEDGCRIKDANGKELFFHIGSLVRRNMDWAGRCSSWCECHDVDQLTCERLPCYEDIPCEAPLTQMEFGERLYLQGRGACMCESGVFVCDTPEEMPDLYPGLYILAGYSLADLELQKKELPSETLERAGFLSADVAKDIASRLQWALERRLPEDLKCRIVMLDELCEEGNAFYQVEWYGMNKNLNHTDEKWYADGAEKVCSPYVKKLVDSFTLNESPRFQLLLSIVKQLRMLDLLDALPASASVYYNFPFAISILYILVRL